MRRQFKGIWIPACIWLDSRLSAVEKVLLAEIDSFSSRDQAYYKTNDTIAGELGCSQSTVKRGVAKLEALGLVERSSFDGRRRALRSQIDPADRSEGPDSKVKWTTQTGQKDPADRSNRPTRETESKPKRETVIYPWEGFADAWEEWKAYKLAEHKFKFKSPTSEQTALHQLQQLSKDNENNARRIIARSIANGWKGLFELPHGEAGATTERDRDQFAAYIQGGRTDV